MMSARFGWTTTGEGAVQQLEIGDESRLHPAPVGKLAAAGPTDLITQKFDDAVVNPIIMRFDDPIFVAVEQPNQAPVLDRRS